MCSTEDSRSINSKLNRNHLMIYLSTFDSITKQQQWVGHKVKTVRLGLQENILFENISLSINSSYIRATFENHSLYYRRMQNSLQFQIFALIMIDRYNLLTQLSKIMAAQRIKTTQMIEQPYFRAANEITHLQIKDNRLQSSILSLKNKIQDKCKDGVCKNCKIFEDQIVLLKDQQIYKVGLLKKMIDRLQGQKKNLQKEVIEIQSREKHLLNDQQFIEKSNKHEKCESNYKDQLSFEKIILGQIQDKRLSLKIKEKRERQIFKNLKKRGQLSKQEGETVKNSILLEELRNAVILEPDLYIQVNILEQKCSYFEDLSNNLQLQLKEKNQLKEDDSLRIINLLDEIQNYKNQLENMDRFYQNQCAQLSQEKQRIIYDFTSKLKASQSQSYNIKIFIQTINKQKDNLYEVIRASDSQKFVLKRQNEQLKFFLAQSKGRLTTIIQEQASKSSNYLQLSQKLSILQQQNLALKYKIDRQTQMNVQITNKYNILQQQITKLKKNNLMFQSKKFQQNEAKLQIEYVNKIMQQNKIIYQSNQYQLEQAKLKLSILKKQNEQLNNCIKEQFDTIQRAGKFSLFHNDKIKALERQINDLNQLLESILAEKQIMEQSLKKEVDLKSQYCQKYVNQAEKLVNLNKKCHKLQKQVQEHKYSKANYIKVNETKKSSVEISMLITEKDNLQDQINQQKSLQEDYQTQIFNLQLQKQTILKQKQSKQNELFLKQKLLHQFMYLNSQINNDIEHFKSQNTLLFNKIRQIQSNLSEIQQNNLGLNIEIQQKQKQKEALQEIIDKMQQQKRDIVENTQNQQQLKYLTSKLKQRQLELSNNIERYSQLQQDFIKMKLQYDKSLQNLLTMSSAERRASENIIYLNQKVESMTKVYESGIESKNNQQLIRQLNNKKQMITQLLTNSKYLEKTLIIMQSQFDKLTEEHQKYVKKTQKQNFQFYEKISQRERQIATLKRQKEEQLRQSFSKIKDMEKRFRSLQDDYKQKQKHHQDDKNQFQKQLAKLAQEKRKFEQSSSLETKNLNQTLEKQKKKSAQSSLNGSPVKVDDSKRKEIDSLKKNIQENTTKITQLQQDLDEKLSLISKLQQVKQQNQLIINQVDQLLNKANVNLDQQQHQLLQITLKNKQLTEQLTKKNLELQKILQQIITKERQHVLMQQNIRNIQTKYHQLNIQHIEKNVAYDLLWMQLDETNKKVKNLEKQLSEYKRNVERRQQQNRILIGVINDSPYSSKNLNRVSSDYEQINDEIEIIQANDIIGPQVVFSNIREVESYSNLERKDQNHQGQINLKLQANKPSIEQIPASSSKQIQQVRQEAQLIKKQEQSDNIQPYLSQGQLQQFKMKYSSRNLLFENDLSDILSDSEQNDKIDEMISNQNSDYPSHLESSIEALSQYSHVKSTKSELNHKQIQDRYKVKMKNTKMLANLEKNNKKK